MNSLMPIAMLTIAVVYYYSSYDSFDPESLKGKRVLITGSSSGIGEHLAYQYSTLGARVFLAARRKTRLEEVAKKCKELGAQQVEFMAADLGEKKDRDAVMAEAKKQFGGLDHLILNHAIVSCGFWLGTKENMTKFQHELDVNFLSFVDLASQALPMFTESKGNIGVVSSIDGKFAIAGLASYCAAKHAMQGFFSALRQELLLRHTGISVTTCVLGPVDTDIVPISKEDVKAIKDSLINVFATAEDTAVAIMRGVTSRKYEIYFGRIAWVLVTLHKIFPGCIEDYLGKQSLEMLKLVV